MQKIAIILTVALSTTAFAATPKTKKRVAAPKVVPVEAVSEAQSPEYSSGFFNSGNIEIEPSLGLSFINPETLNTLIKDTNKILQDDVGAKGFALGEVGATTRIGGSALYRVFDKVSLGLGFNHLSTSSETSSTVNDKTFTGSHTMGASFLTLESRIMVFKQDALEVVVAPNFGMGFYSGKVEFAGNGLPKNISKEFGSSGVVFGAGAATRYWFSKNVGAGLAAGYKFAKSPNLKLTSSTIDTEKAGTELENNKNKVQVDASGLELGASVIIRL